MHTILEEYLLRMERHGDPDFIVYKTASLFPDERDWFFIDHHFFMFIDGEWGWWIKEYNISKRIRYVGPGEEPNLKY